MISVLRANPKKNLNGIQLDPLGHKINETQFSMDLSESGNSMKIMSPEMPTGKKNVKSNKFVKLLIFFKKKTVSFNFFKKSTDMKGKLDPLPQIKSIKEEEL